MTPFPIQYNWHRWYDATVGRWISEDLIVDDVANTHRYVTNSASNSTDPTGLKLHIQFKLVKHISDRLEYGDTRRTIDIHYATEELCGQWRLVGGIDMEVVGQARTHFYERFKNIAPPGAALPRIKTEGEFRLRIERILENIAHEMKHVAHLKGWYMSSKSGIQEDLNTDYIFPSKEAAETAGESRKKDWLKKWSQFRRGEFDHTNFGWGGYRNPPLYRPETYGFQGTEDDFAKRIDELEKLHSFVRTFD